jgi:hypothetical protein
MKKIFAFAAAMIFAMSGCGDNTDSTDKYYEQTHYSTIAIAGEQVWLRNYSANRLSQAYEKFTEDYDITVINENSEEVGSGTIHGGILNLTADNVPGTLLDWDDLKVFFNVIVEGEGWDVAIDKGETNGTFIEILTEGEGPYILTKEGLSGTRNSISAEWVFFVYVDRNCTISGESKEDEQVMYTFNPFSLELKEGWNTIWHKQTYTTSGRASFFMDIKNPDIKWVIIPMIPTT